MKITNKNKKIAETALRELTTLRGAFKIMRERITELNQIIIANGGFPEENARIERNKAMYKLWKDGQNFAQIAKEFKLTPTSVNNICNRIDRNINWKNTAIGKTYKSLRKYK